MLQRRRRQCLSFINHDKSLWSCAKMSVRRGSIIPPRRPAGKNLSPAARWASYYERQLGPLPLGGAVVSRAPGHPSRGMDIVDSSRWQPQRGTSILAAKRRRSALLKRSGGGGDVWQVANATVALSTQTKTHTKCFVEITGRKWNKPGKPGSGSMFALAGKWAT